MPLIDMTDMLHHAYRHGYAVGAFGVAGWDILEGVIEAAEHLRAPIILSLSKSYPGAGGIESLAKAVIEMGQRATIPVSFQVEVDNDPQLAEGAIGTGCGGVVFNASSCLLPENVALTKKVVNLAAPRGVLVVGQLGHLESVQLDDAAESAAGCPTSPLEAKHYVERSGVGCLAVSVSRISSGGSKHDFPRLSKINQAVGIPLAIHGSAGFTDDQFRRLIRSGAAKVNYCEPLFEVAARRIRENTLAPEGGYAGLVEGVREAIRIEAERCIRIWGCGGRAAEILTQCRTWTPAVPGLDRKSAETEASRAFNDTGNAKVLFARSRP